MNEILNKRNTKIITCSKERCFAKQKNGLTRKKNGIILLLTPNKTKKWFIEEGMRNVDYLQIQQFFIF